MIASDPVIHRLRGAIVGLVLAALGCDAQEPRSSGFHTRTYLDPDQREFRYLVFAPERSGVTKLPVIMFLNGFGQNGSDGLRQISNNFGPDVWRRRDTFPFLAVCPQCEEGGSWAAGGPDAERAIAILDEAIRDFGGDPDRVYLTGVSAGGAGVWSIGDVYADRFAALVPIAATGAEDLDNIIALRVPVWSFCNAGDADGIVSSARRAHQQLIERGLSPLFTEYDRGGHNAWDAAYSDPALWQWLLHQGREANAASQPCRPISPDEAVKTWEHSGGSWERRGDELLGTATEGEGMLFAPPVAGNAEFHLESFLDDSGRASLCVNCLHDEAVLYRANLLLELPSKGDGGFRSEVGRWLTSLDPVAQQSLEPGWNEVRIRRNGATITVAVNGRDATSMSLPECVDGLVQFGLTVNSGSSRSRHLRIRGVIPPIHDL